MPQWTLLCTSSPLSELEGMLRTLTAVGAFTFAHAGFGQHYTYGPIVDATTLPYEGFVQSVVQALRERPCDPTFTRDGVNHTHHGALQHFLALASHHDAAAGEWAEFGAFSGHNTLVLAKLKERVCRMQEPSLCRDVIVHSFDSFQGLPTLWKLGGRGGNSAVTTSHFDIGGKPPYMDKRIHWHVGWFNTTVPKFASALAHKQRNLTAISIDCDIYSSTAEIFASLESRIAPRAYLIFDELINYGAFREHEMRALYEMARRTARKVEVVCMKGPKIEEDVAKLDSLMTQGKIGLFKDYPKNALVRLL